MHLSVKGKDQNSEISRFGDCLDKLIGNLLVICLLKKVIFARALELVTPVTPFFVSASLEAYSFVASNCCGSTCISSGEKNSNP